MKIEINQMWKNSHDNIFVVDGMFDNGQIRCHKACTTEEVIFNKTDFENMEFLRLQNAAGCEE